MSKADKINLNFIKTLQAADACLHYRYNQQYRQNERFVRSRACCLKFINLISEQYRFARLILHDCVKNSHNRRSSLRLNEKTIHL